MATSTATRRKMDHVSRKNHKSRYSHRGRSVFMVVAAAAAAVTILSFGDLKTIAAFGPTKSQHQCLNKSRISSISSSSVLKAIPSSAESTYVANLAGDILSKGSNAVGEILTRNEMLATVVAKSTEVITKLMPDTSLLHYQGGDGWEHLYAVSSQIVIDNPWHSVAVVSFSLGTWFQLAVIKSPIGFSNDEVPYAPGADSYSPAKGDEFYGKRKFMVMKRIVQLGVLTSSFTTGLLFDWLILGKLLGDEEYKALQRNEPRRAKVALRLCEQLGPTFIKLGQALSIRTDLIPAAYALELRALQDAVTPFENDVGREILKREFNVDDLSLIFSDLTEDPVASASVGQVYRGVLAVTGQDVAVKIQRPGILSEIALDLYILRLLTPIQTRLQNAANGVETTQDDIDLAVTLVDEWGRGFVAETDYRLEAKNTKDFQLAMDKRKLDAVCAPTVVDELVRDKVLVTEWVKGTRLDLDASTDVPRLCGVAINAYLTMLLDTGVLHCDPHLGNLLRTEDGKLCILDWGMTLDVPSSLQYALLEFIAHINVEDYESIPQDFINLGFSPPDVTAERLKSSGITEGLSFTFRQLAAGGGPKKIQERVKAEFQERYGENLSDEELRVAAQAEMKEKMEEQLASEGVDVKGVTNIMEEVSKRNRELFSLPPYVLYLARAFSTLEGIGLSIDENYSIIQECYPYLASRLFTDRNPRAKKALRLMLGLKEGDDLSIQDPNSALALVRQATLDAASANGVKQTNNGLSPAKLVEMTEGFASYTSSTTDADREGKGQAKAAAEFSKLFLDPKGSTLQDILVEETAKFGDAMTRRALRAALVDNPLANAASSILKRPKQIFGQNDSFFPSPLKSLLVDRPAEIPGLIESLLASTEEDDRIIETIEELRSALGPLVVDGIASNTFSTTSDDDHNSAPAKNSNDGNLLSTVSELLSDEETRNAITEQLPGVVALSRRMTSGLLRRAAYRTERAHELPEDTRKQLTEWNNGLAAIVQPQLSEEEQYEEESL